jgi:hypothetical protein
MESQWLRQGFFQFGNDGKATVPQKIRSGLCSGLGLSPAGLSIASYPTGPAWRHTVWWRQGSEEYARCQFFMQIAADYPVLSVGVSVEKGLGDDRRGPARHMDRSTWHWPHLVRDVEPILSGPVATVHAETGLDIFLRLHALEEPRSSSNKSKSYSLVSGEWTERRRGRRLDRREPVI